jgi:hypothetical protein
MEPLALFVLTFIIIGIAEARAYWISRKERIARDAEADRRRKSIR